MPDTDNPKVRWRIRVKVLERGDFYVQLRNNKGDSLWENHTQTLDGAVTAVGRKIAQLEQASGVERRTTLI